MTWIAVLALVAAAATCTEGAGRSDNVDLQQARDTGGRKDVASERDGAGAKSDRGAGKDSLTGNDGASGAACDKTLRSGEGTYYAADGSGNCSFDKTTNLDVAAMNMTDYAGSAVCGGCIHIQGPLGSVTVRLVDSCPGCKKGDVDLSKSAFAKIAKVSAGRVAIKWRHVSCAVTGPVRYHFKTGSSKWWSAVQVRNHRNRIATFEYLDKQGAYKKVSRVSYNFFVESKGMGPGPYTFRVTDVHGQTLVDKGIALKVGGEVPGKGQFPKCN